MSKSNEPKSKKTDTTEAADKETLDSSADKLLDPETNEGVDAPVTEEDAGDQPEGTDLLDASEEDVDSPPPGEFTRTDEISPADEQTATVEGSDAEVVPDPDMPDPGMPDENLDTEEKAALYGVPEPETDTTQSGRDSYAASAAPVTSTVVERKGGFWPMALGGAVAAALGFGAATFLGNDNVFETETRSALGTQTGAIEDLQGKVSALADQDNATGEALEKVSAEVASVQESVTSLQGDLTALGERLATVEGYGQDLTALDERLTELAKRPIADTVSREAIKAYEDELERLRGSMEEQRKAIEETIAAEKAKIEKIAEDATQMEERALEEARLAAARSAMSRIVSALDNGTGFEDALAELKENVEAETAALETVAAEGVVTQSVLRERFPDAARTALRAARDNAPPEEGGGGIGGVLEKMFEVRSVEPRDGVGADAVLSRAEAAVRRGDLGEALTEIETLPDVAKEALSDWVADARARLAALDEANAIAARLNQ